MKGIVIGDLHLGKMKWLPDSVQKQMDEVEKAIVWADDEGIDFVVFLGDVSEKEIMGYDEHIHLIKFLTKWHDKEFHIILGNHDMNRIPKSGEYNHSLRVIKEFNLPNVTIWDKPGFLKYDDVCFNFLPFPHREQVEYTDLPTINFAHVEVKGALYDNGMTISDGKLTGDPNSNWIIGHLHNKQKRGNVWYPGTLYQTNFQESLSKGWCCFNADEDGIGIDWIKNTDCSFQLKVLKVESLSDLETIVNSDETDIWKIVLNQDMVLPSKFLVEHSSKIWGVVGQKKTNRSFGKVDMQYSFSPLDGLSGWFKKENRSKEDFVVGKKLVQDALSGM